MARSDLVWPHRLCRRDLDVRLRDPVGPHPCAHGATATNGLPFSALHGSTPSCFIRRLLPTGPDPQTAAVAESSPRFCASVSRRIAAQVAPESDRGQHTFA